jgi:hypothetical protein
VTIIGDTTSPSVWSLLLPRGNWAVFAKALATGGTNVDCKLMSHSDTIPPSEIDDLEIRTDIGPVTVALTGLALTDDDVTGVDLVCGSLEGAAAMGRIKIVAIQAASPPAPTASAP